MTKNECSGIWVFAEQRGGRLDRTALELLGKAQELKKNTGEEVTAVLLGSGVEALADTLAHHGADRVILARSENLKAYSARPYQKVLTAMCEKYKPSIFVFGATAQGRDLAPRVMCSLGTGLTADAVDLGFDEEGAFVQTTPAFGGSLLAHIAIPELRPQMVTVRAHVFDIPPEDPDRRAEVILEDVSVEADGDYEVMEAVEKVPGGVSINSADVLVAGGRGIKSEADIAMLRELASLTRRACLFRPLVDEAGLRTTADRPERHHRKAQIYSERGHLRLRAIYGRDAEGPDIATVNTYDRADMFAISHYGAVADYSKLLPAVIAEISAGNSKIN